MYRRELTMRVASSVIPVLRSSGQVAEGFRLQRLERDRDVVLELLFDRTFHGSLRSETGVENVASQHVLQRNDFLRADNASMPTTPRHLLACGHNRRFMASPRSVGRSSDLLKGPDFCRRTTGHLFRSGKSGFDRCVIPAGRRDRRSRCTRCSLDRAKQTLVREASFDIRFCAWVQS